MRRRFQNPCEWHRWFAWRPVFVELDLIWWEPIERRLYRRLDCEWWEYRLPTQEAANA